MAKFRMHNQRVYAEGDTAHRGPSVSLSQFYAGQSPAVATAPPQPQPRKLSIQEAAQRLGYCPGCFNSPANCLCAPAPLSNASLRINAAPPAPRAAPKHLLACRACAHMPCTCGAPSMQTFEQKRHQAAKDAVARRGW